MIAIGHQAALAVEDTRYYSAMVQAERLAAIGQTIATLSHHIKNILQGIRGGSYLIEMGLKEHDEDVTRKGWNIVERNQNRISALVMDMLTFSKEREPDLMVANLNAVVSDVVELMRVRADEVQVELRLAAGRADARAGVRSRGHPPRGAERGDQRHRRGERARDAGPGRGRPRNTSPQEGLVRITVDDNGPGIPADQMEHLFSPFVSSKKSRGTGLGLPVSQKILGEHGGRILVHSEPGHGCRFTSNCPPRCRRPAPATMIGKKGDELERWTVSKRHSSAILPTLRLLRTFDGGCLTAMEGVIRIGAIPSRRGPEGELLQTLVTAPKSCPLSYRAVVPFSLTVLVCGNSLSRPCSCCRRCCRPTPCRRRTISCVKAGMRSERGRCTGLP